MVHTSFWSKSERSWCRKNKVLGNITFLHFLRKARSLRLTWRVHQTQPSDVKRRRFGNLSVSEANGTLPQVRLFVFFFSKPQQKSMWYSNSNVCAPPRFQTSNNSEIASWLLSSYPINQKHTKTLLLTNKKTVFLILSLAILFPFEGCRSQLSKNPTTNVACCHGFRGQVTVWVVGWCSFHRPMFFRIFSGHEPKKKRAKRSQKNGWNKTKPAVMWFFWTCSKGRCGNFWESTLAIVS